MTHTVVLQGKFHPEILMVPPSGASNKGGWGNRLFYSSKRHFLENGIGDTYNVTIKLMTNRKLLAYAHSIDTKKIDDLG